MVNLLYLNLGNVFLLIKVINIYTFRKISFFTNYIIQINLFKKFYFNAYTLIIIFFRLFAIIEFNEYIIYVNYLHHILIKMIISFVK